jgi:hypothetical protein
MSREQIEYGIEKAKHFVFGEQAIYGDWAKGKDY